MAASFSQLDRPIWHALASHQAPLALGDGRARRFLPGYSPFAAAADSSAAARAALATLVSETGDAVLMEAGDYPLPPGLSVVRRAQGVQMVAAAVPSPPDHPAIVTLNDEDTPAMLALATLTEPGPFLPLTHRLGHFVGIKEDGVLVAMAGERLHLEGFTEVSGVCTHPAHRGQGHAALLTRMVAARIAARGETPFLHSYADNRSAIALYKTLGFVVRTGVIVTMLSAMARHVDRMAVQSA